MKKLLKIIAIAITATTLFSLNTYAMQLDDLDNIIISENGEINVFIPKKLTQKEKGAIISVLISSKNKVNITKESKMSKEQWSKKFGIKKIENEKTNDNYTNIEEQIEKIENTQTNNNNTNFEKQEVKKSENIAIDLDAYIDYRNETRMDAGVNTLIKDEELMNIAKERISLIKELIDSGYTLPADHRMLNGEKPSDTAKRLGYKYEIGENSLYTSIYKRSKADYKDMRHLFDTSSRHTRNANNDIYDKIGVAYAVCNDGGIVFVELFKTE